MDGKESVRWVMKIVMILAVLFLLVSAPVAANDFEPGFAGNEKIGLSLKELWRGAMRRGDLSSTVVCLVRLNNPTNSNVVSKLKEAGLKVRTVLRTVVTGRIDIGDLPLIVALDDVQYVDFGEPVSPKKPGGVNLK